MKFSCEKAILISAINIAARAASSKSSIPALEGLLLEAGERLQISGYDLKTGIRTTVPAEVHKAGGIILNARLLGDIVRRLPDDMVTVSVDDGFMTNISCGMSVFNIMGSSAADYPELPMVDYQNCIDIPQKTLKSMILDTIFAISDNESRPIHTGSLFELEGNTLTVVSVDGYRLALRREFIESAEARDVSFVVPGSALSEISKIIADVEEPVKISLGAKHIMFTFEDTVLISRRLEGEFLNYRQSIPQNSKFTVKASKRAVLDSVERVSLIISDKLKSPVRCVFDDGVLKMSTTTALGRASDECYVEGTGEGLEIGFNNRYLLDALKTAPAEEIVMKINTSVSPCIILPADESSSFLYMILPVRLKANEG